LLEAAVRPLASRGLKRVGHAGERRGDITVTFEETLPAAVPPSGIVNSKGFGTVAFPSTPPLGALRAEKPRGWDIKLAG